MNVRVVGENLPGSQFATPDCTYDNVHVALQVKRDPVGLIAGDATTASWEAEVSVVTTADGRLDFRGPAVHGKRGERFMYLTWGAVPAEGTFEMFRRAKLMLGRVDRALIEAATEQNVTLVATVDLTDGCGAPRCARVDPPALVWSLA